MTVNSKKYFHFSYYADIENCWLRYDSASHNLFVYDPANSCPNYYFEKLVDSLETPLGDSSKGCGAATLYCSSFSNSLVFNQSQPVKSFYLYRYVANGYYSYTKSYSAKFGFTGISGSSYGGGGGGSYSTTLMGCIINGIVYGDTALTHPPPPPVMSLESPQYFLITKGNKYVFQSNDSARKIKIINILKDTVIAFKKYFYIDYYGGWVKYDSATNNVIKISSANCGGFNGFSKVDSLAASVNNTINFCTGETQKRCTRITDSSVFNTNVKIKTFSKTISGKTLKETYAYNFSLISFDELDSSNNLISYKLKGAQIALNGYIVVKGDTASVNFDTLAPAVKNINVTNFEDNVILAWTTPYERLVEKFIIEKYKEGETDWSTAGELEAKGKYVNTSNQYNFTDRISKKGNYYYRVKLIYSNGSSKYFYSDIAAITINDFKLYQNYPNPFNGNSVTKFKLPESGFVNLAVYNSAGKKELELISEKLDAGYYSRNISSDALSSGVHYLRLKVFVTINNIFTETKKIVLIK